MNRFDLLASKFTVAWNTLVECIVNAPPQRENNEKNTILDELQNISQELKQTINRDILLRKLDEETHDEQRYILYPFYDSSQDEEALVDYN